MFISKYASRLVPLFVVGAPLLMGAKGEGCGPVNVGSHDAGEAVTTTTACGSRGMAACAEGSVCIFPKEAKCGATDLPGTCAAVGPTNCPADAPGVCGCDGITYPNACHAGAKGVSVAHDGSCDNGSAGGGPGAACGSRGLGPCAPNLVCVFPQEAKCGATDLPGKCAAVGPANCPADAPGACGCDGVTYSNACVAGAKGVSLAHDGPCESANDGGAPGGPGAACGSRGLGPCAANLACFYPKEAQCGATDLPGTCGTVGPANCPADAPGVCGCDGVTYSNACVARTKGVSVAHDGACP